MLFRNFELDDNNHFIAMEYYRLLLNRTFIVMLLPEFMLGLKINGMVSIESGHSHLADMLVSSMVVKEDLNNPYAYGKSKYIERFYNIDLLGPDILNIDSGNFKIMYNNITKIEHDESKKWGMGYYPHDGKVYVSTADNKKKELIILASQDGLVISENIKSRTSATKKG